MTTQNRLLNALTPDLYETLSPYLKEVDLERGQYLYGANELVTTLYFPYDSVLSVVVTMSDGRTSETGIIGNREVLDVGAFLNGRTMQMNYMVQIPGKSAKIESSIILEEFNRNQQMRDVILRYIHVFTSQISQTAACNSLHQIDQRLARWLLEVQDRVGQNQLKLTQEFIADMLGVRRSSVTQTAQSLQDKGLIRYRRGSIEILDLPGLEALSCECFRTVKQQYDQFFEDKRECSS